MADIRPFNGLQYNQERIKNLADVIALPYDVISPQQRTDYINRSPYNIVRLLLPEGDPDPYTAAGELFHTWVQEQILLADQQPAIYVYHQKFRTLEGEEKIRKGFLARIRIEEFDKGIVLPHEATLFAPKEDRLKLLRACKTNFSAIFGLYADPELAIDNLLEKQTSMPPHRSAVDESGILNSFWVVQDPEIISQIQLLMAERWVLIADGHHRYESCMVYRDEMRQQNPDPDAAFQFTLMYFTNIHHPGIVIFPYNRAVHSLPKFNTRDILRKADKYFAIKEFDNREVAQFALQKEGADSTAFLTLLQGEKDFYLFRLLPSVSTARLYPAGTPEVIQRLDVNILHRLFLQEILSITEEDIRAQKYLKYYKDPREELRDFEAGKLQVAFLMNPTRVEQVVAVAKAGEKMPQKSTYFYPKLMNGFVLNQH